MPSLLGCRIFAFAVVFEVPLLRNAVIDGFLYHIQQHNFIPHDLAPYLEENLRDSALRNMVIDIMMNCSEPEELEIWGVSLAKGFFIKSVYTDKALAPFSMRGNASGFGEKIKAHVCEMYHEHPEGVETAVENNEVCFFDPPLE